MERRREKHWIRNHSSSSTRSVIQWNHEQCPVAFDSTGSVTKVIASTNSVQYKQEQLVQQLPTTTTTTQEEDPRNNEENNNTNAIIGANTDASYHHAFPSDRRRLGTTKSATLSSRTDGRLLHGPSSPPSSFWKTQGLFFGSSNMIGSNINSHIYINSHSNSNGMHSTTLQQHRRLVIQAGGQEVGLIAICGMGVVLGWLALLALFVWHRKRRNRPLARRPNNNNNNNNNNTSGSSSSNSNSPSFETTTKQSPSHIGSGLGDCQSEYNNSEYECDDRVVLRMECESHASPRWLSFSEQQQRLKSGAPSRHSSSSGPSVIQQQQRQSSRPKFYKVGVVRDGRVDVVSSSDTHSLAASDSLAASANNNNNNSPNNVRESQNGCNNKIPWNEILGDMYTDFFALEADGDDHDPTNNISNIGSNNHTSKHSRGSVFSGIDSVMDSDSFQLQRSRSNKDDILRDLEQLEQEVNHRNTNNTTTVANSRKKRRQQQAPDKYMISSLLTTAMQQKNQEGLLREEGIEIWYDAQTKIFFGKGNNNNNNNKSRRSRLENATDTTKKPCGSAIFQYRSLDSDHRDSEKYNYNYSIPHLPTTAGVDSKPGTTSKAQRHHREQQQQPQYQPDDDRTTQGFVHYSCWHTVGGIAFVVACVGILVCSFSMAIFGANTLLEASTKALEVVDETRALALEGTRLVDGFLESTVTSQISGDDGGDAMLYGVFSNLNKKLFGSTNAFCDFTNQGNDNDNDFLLGLALENVVRLWNEHVVGGTREILGVLEGLNTDLSTVSDTTAALAETWIGPYNIVVLLLRVCNALLGTTCGLLLVGAATRKLGNPYCRTIVIPLYTLLVVLSLVACGFFLVGSNTLQDFCGADPDERVLEFLSNYHLDNDPNNNNTDDYDDHLYSWSDLSHDMAKGYIHQCPSQEEIPIEAATVMDLGWDFASALWEVSKLLMDTRTCSSNNDIDTTTSSIVAVGELVRQTSCDFSVLLKGFADVFRCDHWHRLYEEGVHEAMCDSAQSGFVWVATTQSIIVALSLVMLTIGIVIGWPDTSNKNNNDPEDNHFSGKAADEDGAANDLRNATMLMEDEEDDYQEEAYDEGSAENNEDALFPSPMKGDTLSSAFHSDCPFVEEPNQIVATTPTTNSNGKQQRRRRDPHLRSSERMLRRNSRLHSTKDHTSGKTNYLASTSLYSCGAPLFEAAHECECDDDDGDYDDDDEDPNIEVRLHTIPKILDRFEEEEEEKRWDGYGCFPGISSNNSNSNSISTGNNPNQQQPSKPTPQARQRTTKGSNPNALQSKPNLYSKAQSSWTSSSWSEGGSSDRNSNSSNSNNSSTGEQLFSGEVNRVNQRLKDLQEQRKAHAGRVSERRSEKYAPKVQVTVTTQ